MIRLALLLLLVVASPLLAQTGHWVSHAHDIGGQYGQLHAAGDRTAVVTQEQSARLLFFDTLAGAWVGHDLSDDHLWHLVDASGDLALAVADGVAVVYNGLTSTAHELELPDDLLRNDSNQQSFGCGPALAYVATESRLFVFDSELDAWQERVISLPAGFNTSMSHVADDWVGLALYPTTFGTDVPSHAYSLPRHDFDSTGNGPRWGATESILDHGFAGTNGFATSQRLVGYSAITGQFSSSQVDDDHGDITEDTGPLTGVALRTVYAAVYEIPGASPREHHLHAFDTREGAWEHDVREYFPVDGHAWDNLHVGGQYALTVHELTSGIVQFRIYRGALGSTRLYEPEFGATGLNLIAGGSTLVVVDLDWYAWGLNTVTGDSSRYELENNLSCSLKVGGEDWGLFSLFDWGEDEGLVVAYDGHENAWTDQTVNVTASAHSFAGDHCFVTPLTADDMDVLLYSSHHGALHRRTFPAGAYPYFGYSANLVALHNHGGEGLVFDASRDQVYDRALSFERESVGQSVFVGADGATAWGYSSLSGSWVSAMLDAAPVVGPSSTYLGWVADASPARHYQVFNAFHDEWTPLDLTRSADGESLGGRTMVVVTDQEVWAYDPDGPITSLEDGESIDGVLPAAIRLAPAAPNPFNPRTTLAYDLPRAARTLLQVFDLRGRCVTTLVDEEQAAGRHTLAWNGVDAAGRELPSGTYVLRIETEQAVRSQKLTLVR